MFGCCLQKWYLSDTEDEDILEHIEKLIAVDKKDDLVDFIRSQVDKLIEDFNRNGSRLAYSILYKCVHSSALNCAAALLEEETDLTQYFKLPGLNLLHTAADALSLKMTRYFLKFGMRADEKATGIHTHGCQMLLPIDFAVQSVRRRVFWTQEQSLYRLIFRLVPQGMYGPRQTMKLLMHEISSSEASEIICRYATEGKIIELASLLIASSEGHLTVDNLYMPELMESNKLAECREMQNSMMSILMLLEIFLRTGHRIAWEASESSYFYSPTRNAVANLLASSGFELTGEDASYLRGRPRLFDELCSRVKNFFPDGMPLLDSFERVADIGWCETDSEYDELLPLHKAVDRLRSDIITSHWKQNESIFELIIVLCLPEMKERLEAVDLFAQKVDKINQLACFYAKEGKLIELAIIFIISWEKAMDPIKLKINGDSSERSMTFRQFINSEMAQAIDLGYRLIGRITKEEEELSKFCKQRKEAMISALPLVGIFEKAGVNLRAYFQLEKNMVRKEQVVEDVMELLAKVGYKVKSEDIKIGDEVDSSMELPLEGKGGAVQELKKIAVTTTISGFQRQDFTRPAYVLPCGFVEGAYGRADDIRKFLFTRYTRECFCLSSGVQSFRAFWTSNPKAGYCSGFPLALKVQKRDVVRGNWLMQKFSASKQLSSVALAAKRGIKYL
ncbi:unnamed protein product [Coffea canephora]|uniref:Uncharacterized protein n=1 Tax=Coffea canephora TaxID=49390 RepID=A0A068TUZ3_COFCA|nr:unnamed protein product [Coffea canephora]